MDEHNYCLQPKSDVFSVLYINVGGIKTKLKGVDVEQYIEQFDLVCLGETKLDRLDDIVIPGYKCYMLNRTVCKAKSGWIASLIKEYLLAFVKPLESSNECVFWFEIDEQQIKT